MCGDMSKNFFVQLIHCWEGCVLFVVPDVSLFGSMCPGG